MGNVEDTFTTFDGLSLYRWRHETLSPKAEVILVHGFCEHSGRYGPLRDLLVARGFNVSGYDQRGHGKSEGLPGHVDRFQDYEADLEGVVSDVRALSQGRPMFIVGHSMGGLVVLRFACTSRSRLGGIAVSAPLIGISGKVPLTKLLIAGAGSYLAPKLRLANEINPAVLSRDPTVGAAYAADPLVGRLVSARWFREAVRAMKQLQKMAPRLTTPVLLMHGTADRLARCDATREFCDRVPGPDKELTLYQDHYHELFNEPDKLDIYQRLAEWLERRLE